MKTRTLTGLIALMGIVLPYANGANVMEKSGEGTGKSARPRVQASRMLLVAVDTETGAVNLFFNQDFGLVDLVLQDIQQGTSTIRSVDTSTQREETLEVCAGTYTLTVNTVDGITLFEKTVVIP